MQTFFDTTEMNRHKDQERLVFLEEMYPKYLAKQATLVEKCKPANCGVDYQAMKRDIAAKNDCDRIVADTETSLIQLYQKLVVPFSKRLIKPPYNGAKR